MLVRKTRNEERDIRHFDTSICHARFRRARVDPNRKRNFDPGRKLSFDHNRKISARMKGVQFREGYAIGFRHMLLDNIDEVSDPGEWVDMGKAKIPETYSKKTVQGWEGRWGQEKSFEERWKLSKKIVKGVDPKTARGGISPYSNTISQISTPSPPVQAKVIWEGEVTPVNRKRANALNEYGLTLMELKDYDQAKKYFDKAIEMDPEEGVYRTNRERCMDWIRYISRGRKP